MGYDIWRDFSSPISMYETQYNVHTGAFRHRLQRLPKMPQEGGARYFWAERGIGPWIGGPPPDRPGLQNK